MKIAAVIPNWNGARLLDRLLPTVATQTRLFDSVIVVDNGSRDDSADVADCFGCEVVRLNENKGFAPAVNAGVAVAKTDAVCIINNDVELGSNWLEFLSATFADPTVAFAVGKIVSTRQPDLIDGTFDAVSRGACAARLGARRADGVFWETPRRIQFAPFTAILIRTQVYERVGGLDAAFGSYLEDVDFGLRCASFGYNDVYEPRAVARHAGSATLGRWNPRIVRNLSRNQVFLLARHYDRKSLARFGWAIAAGQLLWGLVAARHGAAGAWFLGKIEGVRRFRDLRRSGCPVLTETLLASERLIWDVQSATGLDLYWRLYFALTLGPPR